MCFPRTRGDGPFRSAWSWVRFSFPPHARGWTSRCPRRSRRTEVSPARAGMDPPIPSVGPNLYRFPRTRGDGPAVMGMLDDGKRFPPHARGWTPSWRASGLLLQVSPARAGMDRRTAWLRRGRLSFPRTRGDGPPTAADVWIVTTFPPARAGMDPWKERRTIEEQRFPRTRGDGPSSESNALASHAFPPHARGWTRRPILEGAVLNVSPARAGMDPRHSPRRFRAGCFPRTRGDGPPSFAS